MSKNENEARIYTGVENHQEYSKIARISKKIYVGLSRASSPYMMSNPYIESIGP